MPIYDYKCSRCFHAFDTYQKMNSPSEIECPRCGYSARRVPSLCHTDLKEFHKPIEMLSVACDTDEEIRRVQRETGVQISSDPRDPNYGVPVAKNRKEKLAVLKAQKFCEVT